MTTCSNPECGTEYEQTKPWQRFCQTKCKRRVRTLEKREAEYKAGYMPEYSKGPRFRYNVQKNTAKRRGIEFLLSFEQWWSIWEDHWEQRGKLKDELAMCRFGDEGAYEVGNVYLDSVSNNAKQNRQLQLRRTNEQT